MLTEPTRLMDKDECWLDIYPDTNDVVIIDEDNGIINISMADAIAAARAILKHFNATLESDQ